ncbi:hypothetical protein [Streptomyces sp. NBC_00439]|uniref:hypothetical protein n=1 Tax=Streptomyces sp. NBC_00439 TaxID=2903650 RepID=UPI0022549D49|nr:hypothetical protein [Streptomyces sp. NBC_00439]MCX5106994.1 hypothetical protein [Streptomyces sp. NBC_00439]
MAVILLAGFALLSLCCVVVVAIVVFSRTADKVVVRTRQEDLPRVLELVGQTLSGLVAALGRGIRQALPVGGWGDTSQPSVGPAPGEATAEPEAGLAAPADGVQASGGMEAEAR